MEHIVIITAEQLLAVGLRELFRTTREYLVISAHPAGIETACTGIIRPDILISDKEFLSPERIARVRFGSPRLRVFVFDRPKSDLSSERCRESGCAAYDGVIDPQGSFEDLLQLLSVNRERRNSQGEELLSESAASAMPYSILSSRECEVLSRLSEGATSKEIAYALGIRQSTVEVYRRSIIRKTGIGSVAELTRYAIRSGLSAL